MIGLAGGATLVVFSLVTAIFSAVAAIGVISIFSNIVKFPLLVVIADRVDW